MEHGFGFNTIWVIDSVPDGERKTGEELYEFLCLKNLRDRNFIIEFIKVQDRRSLFESLERVKSKLLEKGQIPLLHFDMHGSAEGLQLKSGDFVRYEELLPLLREINILTQHNLFLMVAACEGVYFIRILIGNLSKPAPFWGICGPAVEIYPDDVIKGYSAFYDEVLTSGDLNAALEKLKQAIPHQAEKIGIESSVELFMKAFKGYLETYCTPEAVDERVNKIMGAVKGECEPVVGIIDSAESHFREYVKFQLGTKEGQQMAFEKKKAIFFLHDRYPTNKDLPNPSFDLIIK